MSLLSGSPPHIDVVAEWIAFPINRLLCPMSSSSFCPCWEFLLLCFCCFSESDRVGILSVFLSAVDQSLKLYDFCPL